MNRVQTIIPLVSDVGHRVANWKDKEELEKMKKFIFELSIISLFYGDFLHYFGITVIFKVIDICKKRQEFAFIFYSIVDH